LSKIDILLKGGKNKNVGQKSISYSKVVKIEIWVKNRKKKEIFAKNRYFTQKW